VADDEPIQVLMHPALVDDFKAWLAARGLELRFVGALEGSSVIPTWLTTPTEETLRRG
jgi:hypothetical protein